ncbi:MAG TPA: PDZ domain-containing protein, partial [Gemmatimonadales bacterium]|nr:PDZ domain-containing protein [Gemmatimonadales bacterium]
ASAAVGTLGIEVAPLDRVTAQQLELPQGLRGVVVADVRAGGPAFEQIAGPDNGGPDIILAVEGKPVARPADFRAALRGTKPGDIVSLSVFNSQSKTRRVERIKLQ